jgi:site-specific recombinase XerD
LKRSSKQGQALTLKRLDAAEAKSIQMVVDALASEHSRRAYRRALEDFFHWHRAVGRPRLDKATVQRYATTLRDAGMAASSVNQRLSAIRRLATEAEDNSLLDPQLANGIRAVKSARREGRRTGNWLTREEAQAWLNAPHTCTLKGRRDRALLAVLIGCGLRRAEAAALSFDHIQQRDGRWVLVDLIGKRDKIRSVPMPGWAKAAIDEWSRVSGIAEGLVFRAVNKGDRMVGEGITAQAIYNAIVGYADELKKKGVAPHDLRRTFAKLAHKGGAPIDQIQLSLGHESIQTTEAYLGVEQDLTDAPCDHLGLRLSI